MFVFVFDVEVLTMLPRQKRQHHGDDNQTDRHAPAEDIEEIAGIFRVVFFKQADCVLVQHIAEHGDGKDDAGSPNRADADGGERVQMVAQLGQFAQGNDGQNINEAGGDDAVGVDELDRKSTRLNSSH